ncbi:MAG: hypothetical protein E7598_03255 [Ruminococcaceae bacterium]|nr:hypothetical protein [Oscillospiraceae bacterium]
MFYYNKKSVGKVIHTQNCFHVFATDIERIDSFDTLSEAYGSGYRFCKHCNIMVNNYRKEEEMIADFCLKNGLSTWLQKSYIGIASPRSKWKLVIDHDVSGLDLYHRNTVAPDDCSGEIAGYHHQHDIKRSSIMDYLEYIVGHDSYRIWNPIYPKSPKKKEKAPPKKGTRRYRNAQKRAKKDARRSAINNVIHLIDKLQDKPVAVQASV